MKIVQAQPAGGEFVERRHLARPAKGARLPEANVIEQNDHNIWRSLRCFDLKAWRRLGVARIDLSDWLGHRLRDRQDIALAALLFVT